MPPEIDGLCVDWWERSSWVWGVCARAHAKESSMNKDEMSKEPCHEEGPRHGEGDLLHGPVEILPFPERSYEQGHNSPGDHISFHGRLVVVKRDRD